MRADFVCRIGDEIGSALEPAGDLIRIDGRVFEQQPSRGAVIAADSAHIAHADRTVFGAGNKETAIGADTEIHRDQMRAVGDERRRQIDLERGIFDGGKSLAVAGERAQLKPADRKRAFDLALVGREGDLGSDMRGMTGDLDRSIEPGVEIGALPRQTEIRLRCDDKQARRFVEEGQPRIVDRKALQRVGLAVIGGDRILNAAQNVVLQLVFLDAQPQSAFGGAHQA